MKRSLRIKIGSGEFMSIEIDDLLHDIFLTLSNDQFNRIALANGYVKAEDYEALKAKVAELTDLLEDATDTLDLIESEADLFDATAIASGYVKLEPGQVVATMTLVYAAKFRMDDEILRGEETNFEAYDEAVKIIANFEAIKEARDE